MRRDRVNCSPTQKPTGGEEAEKEEAGPSQGYTPIQARNKMTELWGLNKRSAPDHKDLMVSARPMRNEEAKMLPGLQLLRLYPALGIKEIVSIF